jgi:hypothetical protein
LSTQSMPSAAAGSTAAPAPAPTQHIEDSSSAEPMSRLTRLIFGVYMMVLDVLMVYLLIKIWPDNPSQTAAETVAMFGNRLSVSITLETRYLLIVVLAGGLGSYIHAATSFADFVGNRRCYASWTWWYVLRLFIGVTLALMVYFALRGGLITPTTGASALSPYGIGAVAGLAGMFSKQATDKLREVFETLFKTDHPPARRDKLNS